MWEVGGVAEGRRFYSEWSSAMTFKDRLQGTERCVLRETHLKVLVESEAQILTADPERSTEEIKHHGSVQ